MVSHHLELLTSLLQALTTGQQRLMGESRQGVGKPGREEETSCYSRNQRLAELRRSQGGSFKVPQSRRVVGESCQRKH